ncbi:DUF1993 domain-containing protein [Ancylobacter amanitiformis]|uniref:DUF1993 domain-containing protein n=1 Tax=Ancylobacter amanitiformis TaxID=217069 RepID=A0ABU0LUQ9_9HYPH|nr:DUF1993 domain-containing protein [Ancylobacter amanitiformis]MDQ0512399.1 hypothetical protein [Ancylobacter amanitiformis]
MPLSLYETSIPVFQRALGNLDAILTKGGEFAAAHGLDPAELTGGRLAPDMLPLTGQIQRASDTAKFAAARLTGTPGPSFADDEVSFADLHARIARTLDYLAGVDPAAFDGSETRAIVVPSRGGERHFVGTSYVLNFALPNLFFHVVTAYDILRHKGVQVGKADFLGTY